MKPTVLVIEQSEVLREQLERILTPAGYRVRLARTYEEGLIDHQKQFFQVVLLDVTSLPAECPEGLQPLLQCQPHTRIFITSTSLHLDQAIACSSGGAVDYIAKPFRDVDVLNKVDSVVQDKQGESNVRESQSPILETSIVGSTIRGLLPLFNRISSSTASVLISGESGSGKGLLAKEIHESSARSQGPFLTVDCRKLECERCDSKNWCSQGIQGIPDRQNGNPLELAIGGSIFLKEISNLSLICQESLTELLNGIVSTSGNDALDVRFLAGTRVDLRDAIECENFSKDLFYKLSVIHVEIPPLRNRAEDILLLTQHFIRKFNRKYSKALSERIMPEVLHLLRSYEWPDNVLEFQNVIERAVVFATSDRLTTDDVIIEGFTPSISVDGSVPARHRAMPDVSHGIDLEEEIRRYETELIVQALRSTGGHQSRAARLLRMNATTLNSKIKKNRILI
jgi:two-component system response regulator HydG